MNVSFGNAVELIIFIIALVKNEIRVVQAALVGSILANLLLILGMALLIGGLQYREQVYDSLVTQMSASLLALAVLSLLIPVLPRKLRDMLVLIHPRPHSMLPSIISTKQTPVC
jgi:calcium/proton exchanger cax